jgi:hypothetical protein
MLFDDELVLKTRNKNKLITNKKEEPKPN